MEKGGIENREFLETSVRILMKRHFQILITFTILIACNNNKPKSTSPERDNKALSTIDSSITTDDEKELFVERGNYEDNQYKIMAYSHFKIPEKLSYDSSYYFKENILSLTDKKNNRTYKIQIAGPCTDNNEIIIDNVTNSLRFKDPLFEVTTPDCSDWYISEFILFKKDTLKKLFDISDVKPVKLVKINDHTLTGTVRDRDEIVADFQDYPITVSLPDDSVTETKPPRQKIDFETEALEEIHGFQTDNSPSKNTYIIKKGTKLILDSIFRDTKQVRLKLNDSLFIICPISEIEGKLQGNAAG